MASYLKSFENSNNLERRYNSASMFLGGLVSPEYALRNSETNLPSPQEVLAIDDYVAIGRVPSQSLVMNCRILVHEAFAAGTTIDLYIQSDFPDTVGALPIETGIVVDNPNAIIQIILPNSGVRDASDVAIPSTTNGNIWVGDNRGFFVVAQLKGTDVSDTDPKGIIEVIFDYTDFGANTGSYTGA